MKRILVLRGGAVGDFLVTLPMLGLLRARWPRAAIELVGNARAAELGVRGGCLDAVHSQSEARWSALYADAPLPPPLTAWLATFDLIVSFWPDPDGTLARRFPLHPGQRFLSGASAPMLAPAARHFCEVLRPLGLSTTDFRSRLPSLRHFPGSPLSPPLPAGAVPEAGDAVGRSIAIHPGSGSVRKNWPIDRWRELVARLDWPVLLVLGEAEQGPWRAPAVTGWRTGGRQPVEISHDLPLPALADRLALCRFFLGHDSGISHLAAAVDTPCVLLFGPTDPAMWAPPGDHVRVIRRGDSLDAIGVNDVLHAVDANQP